VAKTVEQGFREFASGLVPSGAESDAAKNHRASIETCLTTNYGVSCFFRTGSFGNGTSVRGHSDVDYFAVIPTKHLKLNSGTTLASIRQTLEMRFPRTGVHVDCPAVVVPFGTRASETTEIVPADHIGTSEDGYQIYDIPDCSSGWMRASPTAHNAYVKEHNDRLGGKLKPLIRFVKAWKYYRNVPISSFFLELRVTKLMEKESTIIYSMDLASIFRELDANGLASVRDPLGISGLISACSSDTKLEDAKSKVSTALSRIENAREAEAQDRISDAFDWWDKVFNYEFPSYT
jgi:hypothetical protein